MREQFTEKDMAFERANRGSAYHLNENFQLKMHSNICLDCKYEVGCMAKMMAAVNYPKQTIRGCKYYEEYKDA